jgi:DNA polymerase
VPPAADDGVPSPLDALRREVDACTRCPLHETRTRAVFGEGDAQSDLMFVGEAPGYHEDQQGRPFVGAAGKLLEELLATIGLTRQQVFIANVLKSRPPNNRDPRPDEIAACQPYLLRQIDIISPRVVCTLGNFSTKLLSGSQAGITRVRGTPQRTTLGGRSLYLFPIFHPAAALYTPAMLATLKQDILRLPEVLALPLDDGADGDTAAADDAVAVPTSTSLFDGAVADSPTTGGLPSAGDSREARPEQLGLF